MGENIEMTIHRLLRSVCVLGATVAPFLAAVLTRFVSGVAVQYVLPRSEQWALPSFTQFWVVGVAEGRLPIVPVAALVSILVVGLGFFFVVSKRVSSEASGTALSLLCCLSYTIATIALCNTLLGTVMAFVPVREH